MRKLATLLLTGAIVLVAGCQTMDRGTDERPLRVDRSGDRYAINASGMPRGDVLAELERVANVEILPHPLRDQRVSVDVRGATLDDAIAAVMPPDARYAIRYGKRDIEAAAPSGERSKQGAARPIDSRLPRKDIPRAGAPAGGLRKASPQETLQSSPVPGPRAKAAATDLLQVAIPTEPKRARSSTVARETVRLTLQFEGDSPPRLVAAQLIEGRAPPQRMVTGPFLFVVTGADGRPSHYGTFLDPLLQHSYLPEGQHDVKRAASGTIGISVDRDRMADARLTIYDLRDQTLPRALDDESVRVLMSRGRAVAAFDAAHVQRLLGEEIRK